MDVGSKLMMTYSINNQINRKFNIEKIFVLFFSIVFILVIMFQSNLDFIKQLISITLILIISILTLFFLSTRNIIEYNSYEITIRNWKRNVIERIPIERVISFYFAGMSGMTIYKIYYKDCSNIVKHFWLFPKLEINIEKIKNEIKLSNRNLKTNNISFGIEYLFFNNEK